MSIGRKKKDVANGDKSSGRGPKRHQIDDNLRRVYDEMLDDAVPDRFEDLLRQLREQDEK